MDLGFVKEESQSGREIHFEKITPHWQGADLISLPRSSSSLDKRPRLAYTVPIERWKGGPD